MKTLLTSALLLALTAVASAQPAPADPYNCCAQGQPAPVAAEPGSTTPPAPEDPQTQVAMVQPAQQPSVVAAPTTQEAANEQEDETGWKRPVGRRFLHGFRLGWTYLMHADKKNRPGGPNGEMQSISEEFGLRSPNMMLLGYEGFYRIVGHSWLNVLMVGNVTVAGLEQSKFIPAASGLIGFEFNRSFQLGVGVNVTPDAEMPTHMIMAAGWTPRVGSIHTPIHFFFVPDTEQNHRMGATIGMTW